MIPNKKLTQFDSCSGHSDTSKAAPRAVFRFLRDDNAMTVPRKYIHFRPPRIVKTKARWYVEYWYRIPIDLAIRFGNREWKRFRVFEDINRFKTDEYAEKLRKAVEDQLLSGYDPLRDEKVKVEQKENALEWSLNIALDQYIERCKENGLRKKSLQSYGTMINFMKDHFIKNNALYKPVSSIRKEDIKSFMHQLKVKQGWTSNNTYNNYLGYVISIFNWFISEDQIEKNPAKGLELKKTVVTKHKYYDDKTAAALKQKIGAANPYLLNFIEFIYYTATRPKSEARLLKCKNVLFDRKLLFVPGSISKNKRDEYIPMSEGLIDLLKSMGVDKAPPEYFIFSVQKKPSEKPASQNHFALQFKPFKDALGLGEDYTIYAWKHVRAIHLASDGVDPYEIMKLFRHTDLSTTMIYLRDLGIADRSGVIKATRKF